MTDKQNPYLLLGFLEFMILSTLVVAFFPWSLLFCLYRYGMDETKLIVGALIHDAIKTAFAIISGLVCLAALVALGLFLFLK